jgi:hypothetical protein
MGAVAATLLVSLMLVGTASSAQTELSAALLLGTAVNAPSSLVVRQDGENEIELDADFETRPFEFPLYYALRVSTRSGGGEWELQFIHHKLHLADRTEEIQHFEITDGFNILTLNRTFPAGAIDVRLGGGIVLAHTDSRIRGRTPGDRGLFDTGYEIAGPAVVVGAGRSFRLSDRWSALLETQASLGRVAVTVAGGEAETTNLALHLLFGLSYGRQPPRRHQGRS